MASNNYDSILDSIDVSSARPKTKLKEHIKGAAKHFLRGATMEHADSIAGELGKISEAHKQDKRSGYGLKNLPEDYLTPLGFGWSDYKKKDFEKAGKESKRRFTESADEYSQKHPGISTVANIAGSLAGGTRLPFGKGIRSIGSAAGYGSIAGKGKADQDETAEASQKVKRTAEGALTGAATGGLLHLVGKSPKIIRSVYNKMLKNGSSKGEISSYLKPKEMSVTAWKHMLQDPEVRKTIAQGDIGVTADKLHRRTATSLEELGSGLKEAGQKAYSNVPSGTKVSVSRKEIVEPIAEYRRNMLKHDPEDAAHLKKMNIIHRNIKHKAGYTPVKGQPRNTYDLGVEDVQRLGKRAYEGGQRAGTTNNGLAHQHYNKLYDALSKAKDTNPDLAEATKTYNDIKSVLNLIKKGTGGVDLERGLGKKDMFKISQLGKDMYVPGQDYLKEAKDILSKNPRLKNLSGKMSPMNMAATLREVERVQGKKAFNSQGSSQKLVNKVFGNIVPEEGQKLTRIARAIEKDPSLATSIETETFLKHNPNMPGHQALNRAEAHLKHPESLAPIPKAVVKAAKGISKLGKKGKITKHALIALRALS